jgi:hypothetical protein
MSAPAGEGLIQGEENMYSQGNINRGGQNIRIANEENLND